MKAGVEPGDLWAESSVSGDLWAESGEGKGVENAWAVDGLIRKESARCITLLQDSVRILLECLERTDASLSGTTVSFCWEVQEAVKCGSVLRRIYEEIRQQKDTLGRYAAHFLSTYIKIYSGYGPLKTGINREVDDELKPGVYALVDACSRADFQRLHTVLGEGPCRSTLSVLRHDYELNFKFGGKV